MPEKKANYSIDTLRFRKLLPDEVEVRIGKTGSGFIDLLLYKTARVDAQILIETVGQNWTNKADVIKDVLWAGIGIKDFNTGEYVWRWSAGAESNIEREKGEDSDAFKRAAFRWGIGAELYTAPKIRLFANDGKYTPVGNRTNNDFEVVALESDESKRITKLAIRNVTLNKIVFQRGFGEKQDEIIDGIKESISNAKKARAEIIEAIKEES